MAEFLPSGNGPTGRFGALRPTLIASILVAFAGCDDHTVLTGPDAVAAAEQYRADGSFTVESSTPGADDERPPLIIVDGERQGPEPASALLRRISPDHIERIEVFMACRGTGYYGDEARDGVILIFRKDFDRSGWQLPEYSEERAEACRFDLEQRRGSRR